MQVSKKHYRPLPTPVMRGEAAYYLGQLHNINEVAKKIGRLLWRHGFRAGVRAARKQMDEAE